MDPLIIGSLVFGVGIFTMFCGIVWIVKSQSFTLETRLGPDLDPYSSPLQAQAAGKARGRRFSRFVSGDARSQIAADLARAGLKFTPGEYVVGQILTTVLGLLLGYVAFRGNLLLAVVGGAVGLYLPRWYVGYLQQKRLKAFNTQLPDTIVLMSNALRSGYSFLQSLDAVAKEVGAPMSVEFARVTREVGLGLTITDALENLVQRVPSDDLSMLISAIAIQNEVGGNLAEILEIIATTIRERVRIIGELRTITAQQRLSTTVLSLLPVILGLIMYALNPGYISQLWQNSCGLLMMGTGGVMMVLGYLVIRRIAAIEV